MHKIILLIFAALLLSTLTIAQPQINSISGTFNDGSTITITGSNFGTKVNAKPYLWADFDSGSLNPSPLGQTASWVSIGNIAWQANEGFAGTGGAMATDNSGSWAMSTRANGFYWNDLNQKMYLYRKTKHNFIVDFNWKIWRMWPETDIYPNVHIGMSALNVEQVDCPNGASNLGYFELPSQQLAPQNVWKTEELMYKVNSQYTQSDGEFFFFVNGQRVLQLPYFDYNQKSFCLKTSDSQRMAINYIIHGVKANTEFPSNYRMWWDDVYLDTTWSRVMLSSSPTWTNSANTKEIQIPTTWGTNSISFVVNTGAFNTGSTAYIYVFNSTNGVNANGYPVVIGSTGNPPTDTTSPMRSSGTPSGTLVAGTTSTTLALTTDEPATCRYSTTTGVIYSSMSNSFTTTNGMTHTRTLTGLADGQNHTYHVRCIDSAGNANNNDFTITFNIANQATDTTPPSQVTGLIATPTSTTQINLTWNTATDNTGVAGYRIYRNNVQIATSTTTTYQDTGLNQNTTYQYKINAYDTANNNGQNSTTTTATTHTTTTNTTPTTGQLLAEYSFDGNTINKINNQTATLHNGAQIGNGRYGQGLTLDGNDDYLQLPQAYTSGQQELTITFWINPTRVGQYDTIYDEWTNEVYWQNTITPNSWATRDTSTGTTGTRNNDLTTTTPPTNTWTHLAYTYSDTQNLKTIYINGNQVATTTNSIDQLTNERDNNARIGYPSDGTYYQGTIDEIKIYTKALNQQEIITTMNTPINNQNTTPEGDINNDGNVNILDINAIVTHFGKNSGYPSNINLAAPPTIDLYDIMIVIRNWGQTQ